MAIRKLLVWIVGALGGSTLLFPVFIVLIVIIVVASTSMFSMFTGFKMDGSPVSTDQENSKIQTVFQQTANQWTAGLDSEQQQLVQRFQLNTPYSVLMSIGKFNNNYANPETDAATYYSALKPDIQWVQSQGTTTTKTEHQECSTDSNSVQTCITVCQTDVQTFNVWELVQAQTWNGTFTATYATQTFGQFDGCSGSVTVQPVMVSQHMSFDHKKYNELLTQLKLKTDTEGDNPLFYQIMYALQPNLFDPLIQEWASVYGATALSSEMDSGFDGNVGGPVPTITVDFLKFTPINAKDALNWIQGQGYNSFFTEQDIQTIIDSAQKFNLNPILLLSITGQEQSFDSINLYGGTVTDGNRTDLREIEANPFNVYHSWMEFHPGLSISADIAARTVASHLTAPPPNGMDAIIYINSRENPTHQIYAEDMRWAYGLRQLFWNMSVGLNMPYGSLKPTNINT